MVIRKEINFLYRAMVFQLVIVASHACTVELDVTIETKKLNKCDHAFADILLNPAGVTFLLKVCNKSSELFL